MTNNAIGVGPLWRDGCQPLQLVLIENTHPPQPQHSISTVDCAFIDAIRCECTVDMWARAIVSVWSVSVRDGRLMRKRFSSYAQECNAQWGWAASVSQTEPRVDNLVVEAAISFDTVRPGLRLVLEAIFKVKLPTQCPPIVVL